MVYGYPGSGKTFFARQLCQIIKAAHVHGDRIRQELFEEPQFDKQENEVIDHLMQYMAEEFLKAQVPIVFDANAMRLSTRRKLREMARKAKADTLLVWLQIDPQSAFERVAQRDRRKSDDKYAMKLDHADFQAYISKMQNPEIVENYVVISGKHTFNTQQNMVAKKMYDTGLLRAENATSGMTKPGMVNLVPSPMAGRVDPSRRNITIR